MTPNDYLSAILREQDLTSDSAELKELRRHRKDVKTLLRNKLESSPTIRYGGSKAKGTMNRESYDLDLICYFDHDNQQDGETIAELYESVHAILWNEYQTQEKNCCIRLRSKDRDVGNPDLHIDVVPGRYVDDTNSDCFLHQTAPGKERLKTNLDTHISHVKDSGLVPSIRLVKLWKVRRLLRVKQFALELLVVKLLSSKKNSGLDAQLTHFWERINDATEPIAVEDPANPKGNDLRPLLTSDIWQELRTAADTTLWQIENSGWEAVFGPLKGEDEDKVRTARRAAAVVSTPTQPWCSSDR